MPSRRTWQTERCVVASSTRSIGLVDYNWKTYTMASAAQIDANRRNSQKSTGPRSALGKAKTRGNAVKHGMTAKTIMPVLPQEDFEDLEELTRQAIEAYGPRNVLERALVCRVVRLECELDRADRIATAHLAHRVRMATRTAPETVSADELKEIHDLGSKLFFLAAIGPGYTGTTADDYPAVIVRRLEESAEGCRWLLARWAELLYVIRCRAGWGEPEIVRMIGLLGKRGIEAYFDPDLNSLFQAFDMVGDRSGQKFWNERRDHLPVGYIGGLEFARYRQLAPPPSDPAAATELICTVIEKQLGRLTELLTDHQEIEAEEAAERHDRAALDCSQAFERHRRHQSALHRQLMRTLEALRRMGLVGEEGVASGEWQVVSEDEESGEAAPEVSRDAIVGHDSNRVIDEVEDDKIGILSHKGMDATGGPNPVDSEVKTQKNVPNEAKLGSTQSSVRQWLESVSADLAGRKRSQSAAVDASAERPVGTVGDQPRSAGPHSI